MENKIPQTKKDYEYLVVTDKTSEVIISTIDRFEAIKMANKIRKAGGEVTIFRSTNM